MITKLDVLDTLEEIPICIGYEIDGKDWMKYPRTCRASSASSRNSRS